MFLKIDKHIHYRSTYKCDRCGRIVDVKHKIGLYTQEYLSNSKKYCDLCEKCFRALDRGIKKGVAR